MKLSIARGALLDSLSVVTKALSARTTLPILSGILMTATKDGITLQSTDLEISIRDSVAADVEGEGSIVVPGRLLTYHFVIGGSNRYLLDAFCVKNGRAYEINFNNLTGTESADRALFLEVLASFHFMSFG